MEVSSICIPARFSGPPDSGNGGYTCGMLSAQLHHAAECTLRKPIPLQRDLPVIKVAAGLQLMNGNELIAEAVAAEWPMPEVPSVSFAQAEAAAAQSPAFHHHPFPTCFVCGPLREDNDGLCIFPGIVGGIQGPGGATVFAAPWVPEPSLADSEAKVREEIVWAALDCPTGFAGGFPALGKLVTGRLAVKILARPRIGDRCLLVSWPTGIEGRKHFAAAALVGPKGDTLAYARATWIKLA